MPAPLTHECAAPTCKTEIAQSRLMCPGDWAQVPKPLQREVYAAWASGTGVFSDRYAAARRAAIDAVTP